MKRSIILPFVFCWIFSSAASCSSLPDPQDSKTSPAQSVDILPKEVHIIRLDDATINPVTADYIMDAIDRAVLSNAQCLIIELDTPGGLLSSTRMIVKKILSSEIPVVVYVYPGGSRAGSAGVFITYASHVAVMAPSTNIGAAHPVELGGGVLRGKKNLEDISRTEESKKGSGDQASESSQDPLSDKILNDTVAFIRTMAEKRGRNAEWAQDAVVKSLSIGEQEALTKKVVEMIARDEADLLAQLHGRQVKIGERNVVIQTQNASVKRANMDFRQRFLNVLANPNIAYIFMILGFYGLLYEITHPGIGFPGVAGAVLLILAFFSMQTLPTNYAGVALIALAIVLFIAEVKVISFGLLALGGIICMVLGSMLLFDSALPMMKVSTSLILSASAATAAITIFLVRNVILAHQRKSVTGQEGLIGEQGYVFSDFSDQKEGKIFVHGEIWDAVSKDILKRSDKVSVLEVNGMILKVQKI
ncbi:MAG: nodulation protein NfeD [Candidatus Omnitrophota bacterium]